MDEINPHILVVDDDESLRKVLMFQLQQVGYRVASAENAGTAKEMLQQGDFSLLLTDLKMPKVSGMELLMWAKEQFNSLQVIVITAFGTIDDAVTAMKHGAFDFITKPVNRDHLLSTVSKALEHSSMKEKIKRLEREVSSKYGREGIITVSPAMEKVLQIAEKIAPTDTTTLITGESGTGKELIARMIHYNSERRDGSLVAINCAAIPRDLLESELFGHRKGAFTGALKDKKGKFELAHGGTLFLDEIGELPQELQAKMLRVLETMEIDVIGGEKPVSVDIRIITATNSDLASLVEDKKFREDLYFRINVINIHIPPLRERKEDITVLAKHFFDDFGSGAKFQVDPAVYSELQKLPWPGNVRELRNYCERMALLHSGDRITAEEIKSESEPTARQESGVVQLPIAGYSLEQIEMDAIKQALALTGGNQSEAARLLKIPRHVLLYRLRKFRG